MDKWLAKTLAEAAGIRVAAYRTVGRGELADPALSSSLRLSYILMTSFERLTESVPWVTDIYA